MDGNYQLFRGVGDAGNIDWLTPVASFDAGISSAIVALAHVADTTYSYGLRAVTAGGHSDGGTDCVTTFAVTADGQGIVSPAPAAVNQSSIIIEPAAAGKLRLRITHYADNQVAIGRSVEICNAADIDWENPLATATLATAMRTGVLVDGEFSHGMQVRLAVRVISAKQAASTATVSMPATVDAVGPTAAYIVGGF